MIELQYDLFQEIPDELTELRQIVIAMQSATERQRKALFAKIGASGKELIEMKDELHQLRFEVQALKKMMQL